MNKPLEIVQNFIFNDDVQSVLSDINNTFMDFNILEITGMGNQEIKHSNILSWLLSNSEHNLDYLILENFLKEVVQINNHVSLQEYIYLNRVKKDINIYREQDNIDLLIVDEANKIVIAIENKVYANERVEGSDGGQLEKYEEIVAKQYPNYTQYFIFLTIGLEEPSKSNWLKASHQMIANVIIKILATKDITTKTKIIFESYIDILKRNGIMQDVELQDLCKKIWDNKEYREAFEIILNNKPNKINDIFDVINNGTFNDISVLKDITNRGVRNIHLKFENISPLIYRLMYDTKGKGLGYVIVSEQNDISFSSKLILKVNNKELGVNSKYKSNPDMQHGFYLYSKYSEYFIMEEEITKDIISELISQFRENDKYFTSQTIIQQTKKKQT